MERQEGKCEVIWYSLGFVLDSPSMLSGHTIVMTIVIFGCLIGMPNFVVGHRFYSFLREATSLTISANLGHWVQCLSVGQSSADAMYPWNEWCLSSHSNWHKTKMTMPSYLCTKSRDEAFQLPPDQNGFGLLALVHVERSSPRGLMLFFGGGINGSSKRWLWMGQFKLAEKDHSEKKSCFLRSAPLSMDLMVHRYVQYCRLHNSKKK
jgi:hypothetical protein